MEKFGKVRRGMLEQAKVDKIEKPTESLSVGKAAKSIGLQHFGKFNMLLSKWAHPSALNVLSTTSLGRKLIPKFHELGVKLGDEALHGIGMFLMT